MEAPESGDICRVCRCEATPERPLFHPCICTGSIKFIHQECLVQWLRYSKKEFCELCNYRFSFTPIYSPDMPKRIPLRLVLSGLLGTVGRAVKFWLHYTLVAVAWLGVVPLTACRIYRTLFTGSVATILSLPINVFSTENIMADILQGCAVVTLTLLAFIGLVWLREQILHGGGPAWLEPEEGGHHVGGQDNHPLVPAAQQGVAGGPEGDEDAENLIQNLPEEPAAPEIMDPAQDIPGDGGGEGDQWNPMEWDRAAEELTWERLLGLDGSLVFLEHVFWVVSLNTLFILVFAFCPYHIGHFTLVGFKLKSGVVGVHFSGLLITMTGYCMIGICLVLLHSFSSVLRFRRSARALGLCYVVVKVALLLVAEILVFPVICGWWLDVCSLALFDASLKDRMASFTTAPWASCFIHWLIGMVYVFYFASFVILLREVLRPGVLWFLRNLNDPDFNPIQEMIHLSLARHIRRFCASLVMFGTSILVMLYMPARIIRMVLPTFLPYTTQSQESNVDELAMELLLLLVILPAVQDQNQGREWLKFLVRKWCGGVAFLLNLQSYMFGDQDPQPVPVEEAGEQNMVPANINQEEGGQGLGAAHQALLQREGPTGFQTFTKPSYFGARITGLLILMLASWLLMSLSAMVLPVWLGRRLFSLWVSEGNRVYELYTSATGLYLCLVLARASLMLATWVRQGWTALGHRLREWAKVAGRAVVAITLLMGLIPLLFGLLLELVVLTPVRVQLHQSPIYFLWQDWALGAMYTKITVALTFMGPDWWLKEAIEQLYQDGIRNLNLSRVVRSLVVPSTTFLGLALSLPYLLSHGIAPLIVSSPAVLVLVQRRVYPALLAVTAVVAFFTMQARQFKKLVEHIKNDRYLVGRRLVNYNHVDREQQAAQEVAAPS